MRLLSWPFLGLLNELGRFRQRSTLYRQMELALDTCQKRYALLVRGASDGLWDWDLQANTLYLSPRWKQMLGYEEDDIGNTPDGWFSRVHPDDLELLQAAVKLHLQGRSPQLEQKYRLAHRTGSYLWVLCRGVAAWDATGQATRIAGSQTDITPRKQDELPFQHDALHDLLTGLPNRMLFVDHLRRSIEYTQRRQAYLFGVLLFNLDRFKVINDSLGPLAGDNLLQILAHRLKQSMRPGDVVARFGGDEFAVLLDDIKGVAEAEYIARHLQDQIALPVKLDGRDLTITASVGITTGSRQYRQPEDIMRDAGMAVVRAKVEGGANYSLFETQMYRHAMKRLQLETDLRQAIEQQSLELYYQPIVSLATGRIVGLETLLRWLHPEQGFISPAEFIPLAEETGLIIPIGIWLLQKVCNQVKSWQALSDRSLRGAVNLSLRQLQFHYFPQLVEKALAETGLAAENLELEITESVAIQHVEHTLTLLNRLKDIGLQLTLDDFGTGYSSLSHLKQMPLNALKIDRTFVKGIDTDAKDKAIIKVIIDMAHSLNLRVVAEGVETEKQLDFLKEQGCDEAQGYLFSPPIPAEQLTKLLQENRSLAQ